MPDRRMWGMVGAVLEVLDAVLEVAEVTMSLPDAWRVLGGVALQVLEEADGDDVDHLMVAVAPDLDRDLLLIGWGDLVEGTVLEGAEIEFVDGHGAPRLLAWQRQPSSIRIPDLDRNGD